MKQIPIGTCVPGQYAPQVIRGLAGRGFESVAINFHMDYMGVSLQKLAAEIMSPLKEDGIAVSALGYYCNALTSEEHRANLEMAIDCAHLFGAPVVSTFAGALPEQSVDEAMPVFARVYGELARRAEDRGVRIAFENCPMGGSWQSATCNIAINPKAWEKMFNAVQSTALGLEWEPAHQMIQLIDPVPQLRKWVGRVVHVHGKDANVHRDILETEGIFSDYVWSRTPGFGDCDWRLLISILRDGGYQGAIDIEGYHDPIYKDEWELTGQIHALGYLRMCRGGDYVATPWKW